MFWVGPGGLRQRWSRRTPSLGIGRGLALTLVDEKAPPGWSCADQAWTLWREEGAVRPVVVVVLGSPPTVRARGPGIAAERARRRALGGGAVGGEGWEERGAREGGRRAGGEDPGSAGVFDRSEGGSRGRGGPLGACKGAAKPGPGAVGRDCGAAPSTRRAHARGSPGCSARAQGAADLPLPPPTMLLPQLCWLPLLAGLLPPAPAQKFSALTFLRVDQDKDKDCSLDCAGSPQKPLCASDGRTFLSRCEFQRAKCKDPQLEIAYRGNCKDVSRCVAERKYTQEQARKEFQQVFIPECNGDGTYSQVQCHSYTGYCWCVTPNGRPISGTAVAHKTPRCPGSTNEKLPQREGAGKTDDAAAPALETQPQGDEEDIASRYPTLWTEQVKSRQNKTNKNSGWISWGLMKVLC
nr:SPARC-related modular calcium-binding protein 2 [Aotus nancymaae]